MKIAVIFASGTEEIEGITPVDVLKRAGVDCRIVTVGEQTIVGSHGIKIQGDMLTSELDINDFDGIVIPGGMPGAKNIANDKSVGKALLIANAQNKMVASICASPAVVLAKLGILNGKKATCYPAEDFIQKLDCYTAKNVEVDGNIITANGPKSAMEFSLKICEYLGVQPKF